MKFPTNQQVIEEFRANAGQVGGPFAGASLILLTTTGARTGLPRTSPNAYLRDGGRLHVFASNAGSPHHPAWFHNLRADPRVVVEIGRDGTFERYAAVATEITGEERDRIYARMSELIPAYAAYQAATTRVIPVVALDPVGPNAQLGVP
jgi:deazaflavin-dependent oxidoreductase (nitroreductase family)